MNKNIIPISVIIRVGASWTGFLFDFSCEIDSYCFSLIYFNVSYCVEIVVFEYSRIVNKSTLFGANIVQKYSCRPFSTGPKWLNISQWYIVRLISILHWITWFVLNSANCNSSIVVLDTCKSSSWKSHSPVSTSDYVFCAGSAEPQLNPIMALLYLMRDKIIKIFNNVFAIS